MCFIFVVLLKKFKVSTCPPIIWKNHLHSANEETELFLNIKHSFYALWNWAHPFMSLRHVQFHSAGLFFRPKHNFSFFIWKAYSVALQQLAFLSTFWECWIIYPFRAHITPCGYNILYFLTTTIYYVPGTFLKTIAKWETARIWTETL